MPKRDGLAFQLVAKAYFEQAFDLTLLKEILVTLDLGTKRVEHHVDLASKDKTTLIECKSYTYRPGGADPVNKLSQAEMDATFLSLCHADRKIIVFDDDFDPKKGSLAALFERRNRKRIRDVQVWRHWQGKFEIVTDKVI